MIKKILIFYKQSTYQHSFLNRPGYFAAHRKNKLAANRFIGTHLEHYRTLEKVEKFLKAEGLRYSKVVRGRKKDFSSYDLIITVGGDGTFLEAASIVKDQMMLGINSDPQWSVGRFCSANARTFQHMIGDILNSRAKIKPLNRIKITLKRSKKAAIALNDILICHRNPAAMSRYCLELRGKKEDQRSSGVWIATAAGSTGATRSAGGKVFPETSKHLQFVVRELYHGKIDKPRHKAAIFNSQDKLKVTSLMKDGIIYIDGSHINLPFPFGEKLTVQDASHPLQMVAK